MRCRRLVAQEVHRPNGLVRIEHVRHEVRVSFGLVVFLCLLIFAALVGLIRDIIPALFQLLNSRDVYETPNTTFVVATAPLCRTLGHWGFNQDLFA